MATDRTGAAAAPYNNVATETVSGEIRAAPLNTTAANLKMAAQSHMHELNGKVGWDSMKADFQPPDTGDSSNRWRMVCGEGSVTFAGTAIGTATVTFATDADQGDPSFSVAPRVTAVVTNRYYHLYLANDDTTTTTFKMYMATLSGGVATATIDFEWIAYGKVA